jgi:hypothetical protein
VPDDPLAIAAQLELAQQTARAGDELRYTVINTGTKWLAMGEHYSVERRERNEWVNVPLPFAFRLIGYTLDPGQRRALTARIADDLHPGRYRLRKKVGPVTDPGPWNDWGAFRIDPIELTAEFELTAA